MQAVPVELLDLPKFQKCFGAAVERRPAAEIIESGPDRDVRKDEGLTQLVGADAASPYTSLLEA